MFCGLKNTACAFGDKIFVFILFLFSDCNWIVLLKVSRLASAYDWIFEKFELLIWFTERRFAFKGNGPSAALRVRATSKF